MSMALSPQRFAALSLREQFLYVARQRVEAGLPPYDFTPQGAPPQEVRESVAIDGDAGLVRESASLSDMPNILGNNIYREIDNWFAQYDGQWQKYCKQVELVDYRPKVLAFISEIEDAREVRSERDIQDSALLDKGYQIALQNWARQLTLPFVVVENDDKGFVRQIPQKMINAADRTIQKTIIRSTLEANPNAYDGNALYGTSQRGVIITGYDTGATYTSGGNLISGAASAFDANNLQAGIGAIQAATGDADLNPSQAPLECPAKYLVVPTSLEFKAAQTLNSAFLIGAATNITTAAAGPLTTAGAQNPLQMGGFQTPVSLIVERYLTNTTAWYLMPDADYGPVTVGTRQGRGLRPRLWVNVPQRQAVLGGTADDYLLSISDIVYGFSSKLRQDVATGAAA